MNAILHALRRRRRGHPEPIWRPRANSSSADLRLARAALPESGAERSAPWDDPAAPPRGELPPWEA